MATPAMEPMASGGEELIGLWRSGMWEDGGREARLFAFEPLGFPHRRGRLVIGSGMGADIRIPGDVLISRQHFVLIAVGDEVWLEDSNSKNGTRLNGVRLRQRERLEAQQWIGCGKTDLFVVDASLKLRVMAGSYNSFMENVVRLWGSARAAAPHVGRHHATISRRLKR